MQSQPGLFDWARMLSRFATANRGVALMLKAHRWRGTWNHVVDAYLAPSRFCRDYFVEAGLPEAKVHLKRNFLERDPANVPAGATTPCSQED